VKEHFSLALLDKSEVALDVNQRQPRNVDEVVSGTLDITHRVLYVDRF